MRIFFKEQNPCESSPCQHHSICVTKPNQAIQCLCRPHYTGKFCEYPSIIFYFYFLLKLLLLKIF